jgi:hypothetical protein
MATCAAVAVVAAGVAIVPGGRDWTARRVLDAAARGGLGADAAQQALLALGDGVALGLLPMAMQGDLPAATHARRAIDTRIDVWLSHPSPDRGRKLTALLGAIEAHAPGATQSGLRWAKLLGERTLAIDDNLERDERLRVVRASDRLLGRLATASVRVEDEPASVASARAPAFPYAADVAEAQAIAQRKADLARQRAQADEEARRAGAAPDPAPLPSERPIAPEADTPVADDEPPWDPRWKAPLANITRESTAAPAVASDSTDATPPPATSLPYTERDDLALLGELLLRSDEVRNLRQATSARGPRSAGEVPPGASDGDARELVAELTRRGYTGVSVADLEMIASNDPRVRIRLADRLMVAQTADAPRLLLALTADPDGGVREAAVTALGSSPHRVHVEAAWRVALEDADPRVGRHASRLRARLE